MNYSLSSTCCEFGRNNSKADFEIGEKFEADTHRFRKNDSLVRVFIKNSFNFLSVFNDFCFILFVSGNYTILEVSQLKMAFYHESNERIW